LKSKKNVKYVFSNTVHHKHCQLPSTKARGHGDWGSIPNLFSAPTSSKHYLQLPFSIRLVTSIAASKFASVRLYGCVTHAWCWDSDNLHGQPRSPRSVLAI